MIDKKERSVRKSLLLALAATPLVALVGLIIITVIGAIDQAIAEIQVSGRWWAILMLAYSVSLTYFLCEPTVRRNHERKKAVNGLVLYWRDQLAKQSHPDPSEKEIELVRDLLLERVKVWASFDTELWSRYFPDEKHSESLFGMVDNFIEFWRKQRSSHVR